MDFKYTLDSYSESSDVRGSQNTARIRRTESARKIHIGKVVWLYDWPPPRVTKKISLSYVLNNGKQLKAPINHAKVFIVILIINMNPKHSMYGLFTLYLHLGSWGGKCRLVLWASNIYIYIYYILNSWQMQPLRHKVAFHHGVAGISLHQQETRCKEESHAKSLKSNEKKLQLHKSHPIWPN